MRSLGVTAPSVASLARIFWRAEVARKEPRMKPRSSYRRFVYPTPNTTGQRVSIRRAVDTEDWTKTKPPKTGNARVIDIDPDTLAVLKTHKAARATVTFEFEFEFGKADAYVFGDDEGKIRSPDAMTSRWDRRMNWLSTKHPILPRVTIKDLRRTPAGNGLLGL